MSTISLVWSLASAEGSRRGTGAALVAASAATGGIGVLGARR